MRSVRWCAPRQYRRKSILSVQCPSNYFTTLVILNAPKEIKRGKTPIGKLDQQVTETEATKDSNVPDPYAPFPDGINPATGERGGPRGPEPTRYGDWERKGRVSDF
ncbi:unnamed protein product [Larinioides sclopetarius]|uniref:Succinate dehydrogenase assembly factor 4, mitochondrial n=1 Tax=Larinioides sclopetarius TaxID=280406 RepID=A0AAV2B012_9ARAC